MAQNVLLAIAEGLVELLRQELGPHDYYVDIRALPPLARLFARFDQGEALSVVATSLHWSTITLGVCGNIATLYNGLAHTQFDMADPAFPDNLLQKLRAGRHEVDE